MDSPRGLTKRDVYIIVEKFIGAPGRTLNGFSGDSLHGFLAHEAGVPEELLTTGAMHAKLSFTLIHTDPSIQRRILEGLLERFPAEEFSPPDAPQREAVRREVELMFAKLGPTPLPEIPEPASSSEIVRQALQSARTLLQTHGPAHAIDRIHTALHGYLKDKCHEQGIPFDPKDEITKLYKRLRERHPSLTPPAGWEEEVHRVMAAQSTVLHQLNRIRNDGSLAHPNPPLPDPEAYLFIDAAATFFRYLEAKLR